VAQEPDDDPQQLTANQAWAMEQLDASMAVERREREQRAGKPWPGFSGGSKALAYGVAKGGGALAGGMGAAAAGNLRAR
jgi:hypothetical protein